MKFIKLLLLLILVSGCGKDEIIAQQLREEVIIENQSIQGLV
jgi:hypothetical protein